MSWTYNTYLPHHIPPQINGWNIIYDIQDTSKQIKQTVTQNTYHLNKTKDLDVSHVSPFWVAKNHHCKNIIIYSELNSVAV